MESCTQLMVMALLCLTSGLGSLASDHAAGMDSRLSVLAYALPWASHTFDILKIGSVLAKRNHTFSVFVARHLEQRTQAYLLRQFDSGIIPDTLHVIYYDALHPYTPDMNDISPLQAIGLVISAFLDNCEVLLADGAAMAQASAARPNLFIGDLADMCTFMVSDKLQLPRVDFDTGAAGPLGEVNSYGLHYPLSYVPTFGSGLPFGRSMGLAQRTTNLLVFLATRVINSHLIQAPTIAFRQKHSIAFRGASVAESSAQSLLSISATDFAVAPARPVAPFIKFVGPLSPEPARALPERIAAFIRSMGSHDIILVSFGSQLALDTNGTAHLAQALLQLPDHGVIWKLSSAGRAALQAALDLKQFGSRLLTLDWLPQNDLLAHAAVKLFITHGGIHAVYEAAYHGKPCVGVPLGVDQIDNIQVAVQRGFAVALTKERLVAGGADVALQAIRQALGDSSFSQSARRVSVKLQAAKQHPSKQAADWVEFAARAGEQYLLPDEASMPWWQLAMLDVLAALAAAVLALVLLVAVLLRALFRYAFCSMAKGSSSSSSIKMKLT